MIQYNDRHDVVSGICLYNYPNIPSVPHDWLTWLKTIYRIPTVTERNTMFVHLLVWNERYLDEFLKELLAAIFDITTFCQHVILVVPPRVTLASIFEREMTKVSAKNNARNDAMQFLYLSNRQQLRPKLKIRKVVEEDYDDISTIIGGEDIYLRELYGDYYTSQMVRYPDGCRQLIIGEDADGSMAGVMCLNSVIDINLLTENFELTPYNGLRKSDKNDKPPTDVAATDSNEFLRSSVPLSESQDDRQQRFDPSLNDDRSEIKLTQDKKNSEEKESHNFEESNEGDGKEISLIESHNFEGSNEGDGKEIFLIESHNFEGSNEGDGKEISLIESHNFEGSNEGDGKEISLIENHNFEGSNEEDEKEIFLVENHNFEGSNEEDEKEISLVESYNFEGSNEGDGKEICLVDSSMSQMQVIHDTLPTYHGEMNAFVLEILAMRDDMRPHWSYDFLQAAFECFSHLEYCAIILPFSHPYQQFLQYFTRVPLRFNKDFPLALYIVHRALLREEIKYRRAQVQDRKSIQKLLFAIPNHDEVLADFDFAMNPSQLDTDCFIFECNDTIIGLALLRTEKQMNFIKKYFHIEDYVSMRSIPRDNYGRLLHFVLMPIFSAYHRFFFREIARLSELTVIFYRLHHEDECALVHETVMNAILQDETQVLCEWTMIDWVLIKDDKGKLMIESITIEKEGEVKNLVCDALFNFYEKTINFNSFLAFSRAGLVFDGLLIINLECRTNDPFIFAAGTMTKYSKRFYSESRRHQYYNSVEIGERLAEILRRVIDIHRQGEQKKEKMHLTLPIFRKPIVIACILPGGYYYLHVHKPGKKTWDEMTNEDGEALITGSCTSEIGYFRIGLNAYDSVETVTCFNRKIFQVQNMIALYGKHESMLNELKFRFQNSYISDFFAYFCEPWAVAIFHDKFECLRVENRATLLSQMDFYGDSLIDDCMNALIRSEWKAISEKDRRHIEYKYAGSIYHQELEDNLMNFLEFCEDDLPMYCTPNRQRQMYTDVKKSPLYFEQ
ncbi:cilia- and flagella-associated protein 61-like [Cataglyphis hispanica]|uniref:cilia- and flagella-associated protein 61-like n=1 Tax=Cataglyphis hispanica TaxID=1086592 RepID=UPI0021804FED|nr:cilia- and flagella-associated protein 61-like [Cataglyphis hispanica]